MCIRDSNWTLGCEGDFLNRERMEEGIDCFDYMMLVVFGCCHAIQEWSKSGRWVNVRVKGWNVLCLA